MSNLSGPGAFSVRGDTLTAHNSLAPKFSALMLWFFYLFFFFLLVPGKVDPMYSIIVRAWQLRLIRTTPTTC